MTDVKLETVIVTGASGGIGAAIVKRLRDSGRRVFATMRQPNLARDGSDAIAMDVTSDESVATAVADVLGKTGRIDAVVNNAGLDLLGAVEEATTAEAHAIFETNFFGVHRLCRAVLPDMRARGSGRLVTIGSMAGFLPMPFESFYGASKHALEGYVESLDFEISPFGLRALLIEPGYVKTNFSANGATTATTITSYAKMRSAIFRSLEVGVSKGITPDAVARAVEVALIAHKPAFRTRVGADAHRMHLLRRLLPPVIFAMGMRSRLR
ncbi:MAG: oxidoreductase [Candidatus Velthaea sp.]